MIKKTYRVYGIPGHRQRESFFPSASFSCQRGERVLLKNSDKTRTNEYSELVIEASSEKDCFNCLMGQISDGIFENSRVGKFVEVDETGRERAFSNVDGNWVRV